MQVASMKGPVTRRCAQIGAETNLNNRNWAVGIPVALALLGVLTWAILDAYGDDKVPQREDGTFPARDIADNVLSDYLVPFLALSFVLLAAAIGAIVLARKD